MTDYQTPSAKEDILPETEPIADKSAFSDMPESLPDADAAEEQGEEDAPLPEEEIDYEKMAEEDLRVLQSKFSVCRSITHISQLQNPLRYAELRDLGLSPEEAYLATNYARLSAFQKDNRSHLYSAIPKGAKGESISADALAQARDLFGDLSDGELISLYRRATGKR